MAAAIAHRRKRWHLRACVAAKQQTMAYRIARRKHQKRRRRKIGEWKYNRNIRRGGGGEEEYRRLKLAKRNGVSAASAAWRLASSISSKLWQSIGKWRINIAMKNKEERHGIGVQHRRRRRWRIAAAKSRHQ
jgi:hypothetical protein